MRQIQLSARGGGACETKPQLVRLTLRAGDESSRESAIEKALAAAID